MFRARRADRAVIGHVARKRRVFPRRRLKRDIEPFVGSEFNRRHFVLVGGRTVGSFILV